MSTHTYKKFEDNDSGQLPDKMTVFQDCISSFNSSPVNAKRCRLLLSRLLRLIYNGESLPANEATTLFFSISKLFQHKDSSLRQLVYLAIKELSLISNDVLMVTSSIMKDIQNGEIIYKPNAIRTLSRVLDGSTVQATERLMKNCIVDKNPNISSAALVSSYHLLPVAKDVVKRWTNETFESISSNKTFPSNQFSLHEYYGSNNLPSTTNMYQYHALGLLYHLRNHDKMALMKMINQLSGNNSPLKNPTASIQLIRYANKIISDDPSIAQALFPLLSNFLKHKSDMVELEAAKSVVSLAAHLTTEQFMEAINTLQSLIYVPRTATKFAAVRLLNKIAMSKPEKIIVVNSALEDLINDPNRAISTYAITTLLKTGNSDNIDRLISKISSFMDDITEEFKIVVIDAVRSLSLKFPEKNKIMLNFLNDLLRDEGGFNLKNSIVEAIFDMIRFIPESRDSALESLCEFIEDCEFTELSVRILHLLGTEGPKTVNPTLYVRHIYNRVVLENSIVRSSAVIALSKFAIIGNTEITRNIKILLARCLNDSDDEVRDRAALSLKFIKDSETNEVAKYLISSPTRYSLAILESKLTHYINDGAKENFVKPFDIHEIPIITEEELLSKEYKEKLDVNEEPIIVNDNATSNKDTKEEKSEYLKSNILQQQYSQELSAIPEIAAFGNLLHSSSIVELTEKETEFVVTVIKHIFPQHLVLQYNVSNTLNDIELSEVTVISQPDNELYTEDFIMPIDKLKPQSEGTIYVSFTRPDLSDIANDEEFSLITAFGNNLSFITKEVDPSTNESDPDDDGFQDEYQVEDLEVLPGDFISPSFISSFTSIFDSLPNSATAVFSLSEASSNLSDSIQKLTSTLNMTALENSDYVEEGAGSHILKLFGKDIWGGKVGANVRLAVNSQRGTLCKIDVRAETEGFSEVVVAGFA